MILPYFPYLYRQRQSANNNEEDFKSGAERAPSYLIAANADGDDISHNGSDSHHEILRDKVKELR
eukprot:EC717010.1.p6 GENE.EC717010.1~~EC717010.1.p6  ORF type:complete len:65 (-),score=1.42 EC717010.1:132-326(-)